MKILLLIAIIPLAIAVLLLAVQYGMIYFPRPYESDFLHNALVGITTLEYETSQGAQTAFYLPPETAGLPEMVWVMFNGNAGLALEWRGFIENIGRSAREGFLLIDYPGYGLNEGGASPGNIAESAHKAFELLAETLGTQTSALEERTGIIGHSLGAATGLLFLRSHSARHAILIAPFTSMLDMAVKRVGYPFCYVLLHRFDNRARIAELLERPDPPGVVIIHGTGDNIIPVSMSRELASIDTDRITYIEVTGKDHDEVLEDVETYLLSLPRLTAP